MSRDCCYILAWDTFGSECASASEKAIRAAGYEHGEGRVIDNRTFYWECYKYGLNFTKIIFERPAYPPDQILERADGDLWVDVSDQWLKATYQAHGDTQGDE